MCGFETERKSCMEVNSTARREKKPMKQAKHLFYRLDTVSLFCCMKALLKVQRGDFRISVNALDTEKSGLYSLRKSLKEQDN